MKDHEHLYCVHDKLYDLTDFVSKHPGGTNVFENLKSRIDITPMIYSYHKDPSVIFEVLSKYDVSANDIGPVLYKTNYNYEKYKELKTRVYSEILNRGLSLYWTTNEIIYNVGGFFVYLCIWVYCVKLAKHNPISVWWFVLLSIINIGHCALIFHETSHYTGFKNQQINTLMSYVSVAPILTSEEWKWDHNYLHHGFTNTEFDEDFNGHQLTFRNSSNHPHHFQHNFQHIYAFGLMCLGGFSGQIDSIKHKRWNVLLFLLILYWFGFYNMLVFYALNGFLFLTIAQFSHIQPECVKSTSNDFFENQVTSTINYKTENIVARYMCFGLDIQIEHHLFPNIPHSTLRHIQPIVREYCIQNGVAYIEKTDVFEIAKSYLWHLYQMGINNNYVKNE